MMQLFVVLMLTSFSHGSIEPFYMLPVQSHEKCVEKGDAWVEQMEGGYERRSPTYKCIELPV